MSTLIGGTMLLSLLPLPFFGVLVGTVGLVPSPAFFRLVAPDVPAVIGDLCGDVGELAVPPAPLPET